MKVPTIFDQNNQITLVNLYSQDNPLLEIGEECYFLTFNLIDFHIPLLMKGRIVYDRFNEEINKTYYIQITELVDSEKLYEKHLYGKQLVTYNFISETETLSTRPRVLRFEKSLSLEFFETNLLKIDCFFIRKDLTKIENLRQGYIDIIVSDLYKQIKETEIFETLK